MFLSRVLALVLVLAAVAWIGSGMVGHTEQAPATEAPVEQAAPPPFRVTVVEVAPEMHARTITLSGRTEADNRASAVARTNGVIETLNVERGARVEAGEVLAVLSDEAREAQVAQAQALVEQRRTDLDAKMRLIERGVVAANERSMLEANLSAAEAALAQAEAELERGEVRAPIAGIVSAVPVTAGRAIQVGTVVADIVSLDPMLAVVEAAERQIGGVAEGQKAKVRLVTGQVAEGEVRFVSPTASEGTRTYRIDVEISNPDGAISDGVTAEVDLLLTPIEAARVPRSALTFSSDGTLSVRVVDGENNVTTVPVQVAEDSREMIWVTGLGSASKVIVQGQDFVTDGQRVEPVIGSV